MSKANKADDVLTLLDVNILIALAVPGHLHYVAAHKYFSQVQQSWATCSMTEAGFLRLLLNPTVTGQRIEPMAALAMLDGMRKHPGWHYLNDNVQVGNGPIDWRILAGKQQVTDMHLVEVAAVYGARLATFDKKLESILAPADRHDLVVWGLE